ncbi:uncharacterized protein PAC_14093 [Phialocephala subalpina]|uniref:Uncharacterized protein n=1 Tax=Phialocephala subalpina TaxID=576137 RepID=A0A1L7XGL9_9HELO|nr:uncharacterized protein PAC_14093 [Phialocephala subalpina]
MRTSFIIASILSVGALAIPVSKAGVDVAARDEDALFWYKTGRSIEAREEDTSFWVRTISSGMIAVAELDIQYKVARSVGLVKKDEEALFWYKTGRSIEKRDEDTLFWYKTGKD